MKTTRHSLMAKGILVLLSLLILIFVFTYSWYMSADTPASAQGMALTTDADAAIEIALGFRTPVTENYVVTDFSASGAGIDFTHLNIPSTVTFSNNSVYRNPVSMEGVNLIADFKPIDLTGTGTTLVRPAMLSKNIGIDYELNTIEASFEDLTPNKQYISFDLIVRSQTPGYEVSLTDESFVLSALEAGIGNTYSESEAAACIAAASKDDIASYNLVGSPVTRQATNYGDFSEDSVVGAVRIAFTPFVSTSDNPLTLKNIMYDAGVDPDPSDPSVKPSALDDEPSLLWIPRSDVYLKHDENAEGNKWSLITEKTNSTTVNSDWNTAGLASYPYDDVDSTDYLGSYEEVTSRHFYYDVTKLSNPNCVERYTEFEDAVTEPDDDSFMSASYNYGGASHPVTDGQYYYSKCRVTLWIEGCDAEARKAIDGGKFFFGFKMTAS